MLLYAKILNKTKQDQHSVNSSWNMPRQQNCDSWAPTKDGGGNDERVAVHLVPRWKTDDVIFNILSVLTVSTEYILYIYLLSSV